MAETPNITINNVHKSRAFWFWLFLIFVIAGIFFWLRYKHKQELAQYDALATTESKNFTNPDAVKALLLDAVSEILTDRGQRQTARDYSTAYNVSYQQSVMDMALAQVKALGSVSMLPETPTT